MGWSRARAAAPSVYYRIADPSIYELCDLVCGSIARGFEQAAREREVFAQPARRALVRRSGAIRGD